MRILWITNMMLPEIERETSRGQEARRTGTWLDNWLNLLRNEPDIELAIACVKGKQFVQKKINNVTYFLLPGNGKKMLMYTPSLANEWEKVEDSFHPEVVHIHGTEFTHSISYLRQYPWKRYVLSIQGLLGPISREYFGGISTWETYRYRTLREWLKAAGTAGIRFVYKHNQKYENEIISKAELAIGRYDFDKFYIQSVNPNIKYARCNYSLRDEFYHAQKWNPDTAEKHTIYAGAAVSMPLKGGHILLRALQIVKRKYLDVKAIFVGVGDEQGNLICNNGYKRYIKKLIFELGLQNNVEFLPVLDANGIIEIMRKSYCTVIPSAMDNGSTMLREAMHLGVPSIASYRGGITGLLREGKSGFYFDYMEFSFLAGRIIQLFEDCNLAMQLSKNAIADAEILHDKKKNNDDLVALYRGVVNER